MSSAESVSVQEQLQYTQQGRDINIDSFGYGLGVNLNPNKK